MTIRANPKHPRQSMQRYGLKFLIRQQPLQLARIALSCASRRFEHHDTIFNAKCSITIIAEHIFREYPFRDTEMAMKHKLRQFLGSLAAALILTCLSVSALAVQKIEWKNLLPQQAPLNDPLKGLTQDQRFDIETISWARKLSAQERKLVQNKQGVEDAKKYEREFKKAGIDVDVLLKKYDTWQTNVEKRQKLVNSSLNEKTVQIAGYLLPLEFSEEGDTDFLLVPYVGACIHVPPPPANQIVFVRLAKRFKANDLYTAVWVTGKLKTKSSSKELSLIDGSANVSVGYHIDGGTIEPYKEEQ